MPKNSYEKGDEREREYLDELGALLEDSLDGILNLGGLRVIAVGCPYVDVSYEQRGSQFNTHEMGTMGRAVTTSARREKETSRVCGIVCGVLYKDWGGLTSTVAQ